MKFVIFGLVIFCLGIFLGGNWRNKERKEINIIRGEDVIAKYKVEIADNPVKRARGLMFRDHLAGDQGMLFIFPDQKKHSFWMKNTPISLDIVFANSNWEIIGIIENTTPESTKPLTIDKPSKYILEIKADSVKNNKIKLGDKIKYAK
jgi:hypothetical protein